MKILSLFQLTKCFPASDRRPKILLVFRLCLVGDRMYGMLCCFCSFLSGLRSFEKEIYGGWSRDNRYDPDTPPPFFCKTLIFYWIPFRMAGHCDIFHANCLYNSRWHIFLRNHDADNQSNEYVRTHSSQTEVKVKKKNRKTRLIASPQKFNFSLPQLRYVLATTSGNVSVVVVFNIVLDRLRWFTVRAYHCEFRASTAHTLHLRAEAKACEIFIEENVLL